MTEQTHGTGIEWTHVPGYKSGGARSSRQGASTATWRQWLGYWMFVRRYKEAA